MTLCPPYQKLKLMDKYLSEIDNMIVYSSFWKNILATNINIEAWTESAKCGYTMDMDLHINGPAIIDLGFELKTNRRKLEGDGGQYTITEWHTKKYSLVAISKEKKFQEKDYLEKIDDWRFASAKFGRFNHGTSNSLPINIQTISSHGSSHGSPSKPFHHTLTAAFLRHRPRSSPASIFTSLDLHQLLSTLARFGSISNGAKSAPCTASKMPVEIDQKSVESNEIDSPYLSSCYRFIFKAVEKSECCLIASIHLQDRKMQYRGHFGLLDSPDKIKQLWGYYVWRDSVPIPAVGGISVTSGILKVEYDDNKNDKTSYDVK
ncbi:hypothetical protein LXL04_026858 [Taraxacum kok-saghyz]